MSTAIQQNPVPPAPVNGDGHVFDVNVQSIFYGNFRAVRVCRALDLGPLLERMPGGLMQMVGECGWQLSHGEKSRLYLARALLQGADLLVLDESFAALDPQTLRHALAYVLDKAPTVLVIAHP